MLNTGNLSHSGHIWPLKVKKGLTYSWVPDTPNQKMLSKGSRWASHRLFLAQYSLFIFAAKHEKGGGESVLFLWSQLQPFALNISSVLNLYVTTQFWTSRCPVQYFRQREFITLKSRQISIVLTHLGFCQTARFSFRGFFVLFCLFWARDPIISHGYTVRLFWTEVIARFLQNWKYSLVSPNIFNIWKWRSPFFLTWF